MTICTRGATVTFERSLTLDGLERVRPCLRL